MDVLIDKLMLKYVLGHAWLGAGCIMHWHGLFIRLSNVHPCNPTTFTWS